MDLVDEQDGRAAALVDPLARPGDHGAHVGDAAHDRRQRRETARRPPAASSRASVVLPEPGGPHSTIERQVAALDHAPQRAALADEVLLADELVQRARAHARREWRMRGSSRQVECDL